MSSLAGRARPGAGLLVSVEADLIRPERVEEKATELAAEMCLAFVREAGRCWL